MMIWLRQRVRTQLSTPASKAKVGSLQPTTRSQDSLLYGSMLTKMGSAAGMLVNFAWSRTVFLAFINMSKAGQGGTVWSMVIFDARRCTSGSSSRDSFGLALSFRLGGPCLIFIFALGTHNSTTRPSKQHSRS